LKTALVGAWYSGGAAGSRRETGISLITNFWKSGKSLRGLKTALVGAWYSGGAAGSKRCLVTAEFSSEVGGKL
jgi:hypothetical protein